MPGVDFVPAPVPTRLLAYVLDAATTGVLLLARSRFVEPALVSALGASSFMARMFSLTVAFIIVLGYWVVIPAVSGATPGKRLFGMRVVPERNRPLGLDQVILREIVGHAVNAATLGIGFLLGLSDERQRGLNDRLAGTRIILLTPPLPQVYRVQDLRTVDADGTLASDLVATHEPDSDDTPVPDAQTGEKPTAPTSGPEPLPVDPGSTDAGIAEAPSDVLPTAEPEAAAKEHGDATPGTSTADSRQPPPRRPVAPPPPPEGSTFYARPRGETAYERKMRAAMGPTVPELAEALRRTAKLVEEGSIMPRVLDRKRADFVASMETVDLGDSPEEVVRIVVALGRDGMLTREELGRVRDALARRLRG